MKVKATFLIVGIISLVLVLVCLCIPLTGSTQQKSGENSITKDISLAHIDGNTTLNLDLVTHLGLTDVEIRNLADSLSIGVLGKTPAPAKGVTIEILQPIDSNLRPNALVIREIKTYPAKDMKNVQFKIIDKEVEGWLNDKDFSVEKIVKPDEDKIPFGIENTVLIKIYNTTKSRISLKNWQIRFTYGTTEDAVVERVVDRMSNVNEREWKPVKRPKLVGPLYDSLYDSYGVTLLRKIDFKFFNDPTKTQKEQLSAISDGTHKTGWDIKMSLNLPQWVEVHDPTRQLGHSKGRVILVIPNENVNVKDLPKVDTRIIVKPRKRINESQPPADDR